MWRTVSFVERIEVEFSGNIFNQAILLGDIDNDKGNELTVGNIDGTLCIFKGRGRTPWRRCSNLGMITCVGIGDVFSRGKNNVYCLTAEGWYYVFNIKGDGSVGSGLESHSSEEGDNFQPFFQQHLPPNGKVMLTADVDGDGKMELAIGYSDRAIRLYKWISEMTDVDTEPKGSLIQIDKWQLAGQIGSITLNKNEEGKSELLASQPGGTYVRLIHDPQNADLRDDSIAESAPTNLIYDPLVSSRARNTNISTEIVGNIRKGPDSKAKDSDKSLTETAGQDTKRESDVLYALCTLDGTLVLVENSRILWSLQVDHQLFSLKKLDVTGNGKDEVVCCSWDGQTYIVNHGREAVRYQFDDNVAAFTAGYYAVNTIDNVPCFVYATFNKKIYIYYNISLPQVESTNLIEVMDKKTDTFRLLAEQKIKDPTNKQLRELYHWCLYGWKSTS